MLGLSAIFHSSCCEKTLESLSEMQCHSTEAELFGISSAKRAECYKHVQQMYAHHSSAPFSFKKQKKRKIERNEKRAQA